MPKVSDGYSPKWEQIRIRAKEAEYIRKIAKQYDEKFVDALYRVINYHRDVHLGHQPSITPVEAKPETESEEFDTDMFS